jgi:hypothetical protein
MKQTINLTLSICFAMVAPAWLASASDATSKAAVPTSAVVPVGASAATTNLQPFNQTTYIPAGADLDSIQFEGIRAVKVATTRTVTTHKDSCENGFSEPSGSVYCASVKDGSPAPAFQVTYSYSAPPMTADEYGNTQFTFSVNLRPEELSPAAREAVFGRKIKRQEAAKLFGFTTARESAQRMVIDDANSVFCEGRYTDGAWNTQSGCQDKVTYKTVTVPSDYIAVKIDSVRE